MARCAIECVKQTDTKWIYVLVYDTEASGVSEMSEVSDAGPDYSMANGRMIWSQYKPDF